MSWTSDDSVGQVGSLASDARARSLLIDGIAESEAKVASQLAVIEDPGFWRDSQRALDEITTACDGATLHVSSKKPALTGASLAAHDSSSVREQTEATQKPAVGAGMPAITYVAFESLPFRISGYNTRTFGLTSALAEKLSVEVVTSPGFPWTLPSPQNSDFPDISAGGVWSSLHQGVRARHRQLQHLCNGTVNCARRLQEFEHHVTEVAESIDATNIHAASTASNGKVALRVARKLGSRASYEIRGLWMLSQLAEDPTVIGTAAFRRALQAEVQIAHEVDELFAISSELAAFLQDVGGIERPITVLPNGVNTELFRPQNASHIPRESLGIGSETVIGFFAREARKFEGLDTLLLALSMQDNPLHKWKLLLVGDGEIKPHLLSRAAQLGVLDCLIPMPAVPHLDLPRFYSAVDVAVFPRKRELVTELVPPIKPVEAMACGVPVVVSDCSALLSPAREGAPILAFPRGDAISLAEVLSDLRASDSARRRLGEESRDWVVKHRQWRTIGNTLIWTLTSSDTA